jgi:hypothetical protein
MNETLEDRFFEIMDRAITEAEQVKCSLPEFFLGLHVMRRVIDAYLEAEAALDDDERRARDSVG